MPRSKSSTVAPANERECGLEKQARLVPLFNAARDRVRMEKGTTMYLGIHRSTWTAVMADLDAREGWGYAIDATVLERRIIQLDEVERRLK